MSEPVPTSEFTPRSRPPLKRGRVIAVVSFVLVVGLFAGLVWLVLDHRADERADGRVAAARVARAAASSSAAAAEAAAHARATQLLESCRAELDPLVDALTTTDARLDVGLTQSDLSDLVGDVSVAYSHVDIDALGEAGCLSAGARLETAFNAYVRSVQEWNDCLADDDCDPDSIQGSLQKRWLKASRYTERAKALLASMDPDDPSYEPGVAGTD